MNKKKKPFTGIFAGCMLMGTVALASEPAVVFETFTGESDSDTTYFRVGYTNEDFSHG